MTGFEAGKNIAMKVPAHAFDKTVAFYRDLIGLPLSNDAEASEHSVPFQFGDKVLWIDQVPHLSRSEIWLEIRCNDADAAYDRFADTGLVIAEAIEPLPPDVRGFWIRNPADVIHLVCP